MKESISQSSSIPNNHHQQEQTHRITSRAQKKIRPPRWVLPLTLTVTILADTIPTTFAFFHHPPCHSFLHSPTNHRHYHPIIPSSPTLLSSSYVSDDEDEREAEIVEMEDDEQDWLSDRELIRLAAATPGGEALTNRDPQTLEKLRPAGDDTIVHDDFFEDSSYGNPPQKPTDSKKKDETPKKSPYNGEEEELIRVLGGKTKSAAPLREPGFMGDCTLREISSDFSIPISYIADVLVTWGVPIPVNIDHRLGDLVTGEQAFALLEAIHTLDVADLQDRYSNDDFRCVCDEYGIDLKEAFDLAMREGWNLPFGVRTCMRVEQEEELIKALAEDVW